MIKNVENVDLIGPYCPAKDSSRTQKVVGLDFPVALAGVELVDRQQLAAPTIVSLENDVARVNANVRETAARLPGDRQCSLRRTPGYTKPVEEPHGRVRRPGPFWGHVRTAECRRA